MDLLQQVITDSYPSITTLLKFWLSQLIDFLLNLLTSYPINVAICMLVVIFVVYKSLNKMFGDKLFKATYKPLEHRQNLLGDVKSLKKEIREIQSDIIDIRKKFETRRNTEFREDETKNIQQSKPQKTQSPKKQLPTKFESEIKQKIHLGQESIKFNQALQRSLKQSNQQIIRTLKEINEKNS